MFNVALVKSWRVIIQIFIGGMYQVSFVLRGLFAFTSSFLPERGFVRSFFTLNVSSSTYVGKSLRNFRNFKHHFFTVVVKPLKFTHKSSSSHIKPKVSRFCLLSLAVGDILESQTARIKRPPKNTYRTNKKLSERVSVDFSDYQSTK